MTDIIECPKCGSDSHEVRSGADDNRRVLIACAGCGHQFRLQEIGRQLVEKELEALGKPSKQTINIKIGKK